MPIEALNSARTQWHSVTRFQALFRGVVRDVGLTTTPDIWCGRGMVTGTEADFPPRTCPRCGEAHFILDYTRFDRHLRRRHQGKNVIVWTMGDVCHVCEPLLVVDFPYGTKLGPVRLDKHRLDGDQLLRWVDHRGVNSTGGFKDVRSSLMRLGFRIMVNPFTHDGPIDMRLQPGSQRGRRADGTPYARRPRASAPVEQPSVTLEELCDTDEGDLTEAEAEEQLANLPDPDDDVTEADLDDMFDDQDTAK